jgi:hypothetical protein
MWSRRTGRDIFHEYRLREQQRIQYELEWQFVEQWQRE